MVKNQPPNENMARKTSEKILLSTQDSVPPPGYMGRDNMSYEFDRDHEHIRGRSEMEGNLKTAYSYEVPERYHEGRLGAGIKSKPIDSICLCTASVYPHYHGETLIDGNVYDEILIIDPKELQQTENKRIHLRGKCMRFCKLLAVVFIVLGGLACGLYGVSHYFISNKGGQAQMTKGDAKLLQYSTYFCERIKTDPSDIARSITIIKKRIGQTASFNYTTTKELQLDADRKFYEQSFYAIKQGVLEITIKTIEEVEIIIFDEKYMADAWKSNKNYAGFRFKRKCCKSVTTERGLYEFRTEQDKEAFLVIYSAAKTNANLTMRYKRTFNDYVKDNERCFANEGRDVCSVPLSFASDDKAVIAIPTFSPTSISKKVQWTCEARIWFYVLVFAGIFLLQILLVCICYCTLKYCFCDPCCCCCCCYIVTKEKDTQKVVQYHRTMSTLTRTSRGPRANNTRAHKLENSTSHEYTTSDTSDTENRVTTKPVYLRRTNSEATTQSEVSIEFASRRSSSIGSDVKRGMNVDENYEELPYDDDTTADRQDSPKVYSDEVDRCISARVNRNIKGSAARGKFSQSNRQNNDGYLADIELQLREKKANFSDSDDDDERSNSDDYDNAYDVVGVELANASKSTAEKIDSLPLGPSGAPPRAPPKSASSLKGKPGLSGVRNLEKLDILSNGMTRMRSGKTSPITPNVVVLTPKEKKRSEGYATCESNKKRKARANRVYNRTISLDSGLDSIDGRKDTKVRPAADVKF